MLLIIPVIEITKGRCLMVVDGAEGPSASGDPVAMARLWRQENAKFLHVGDADAAQKGRPVNLDAVGRIASSVDIPVAFSGGLRRADDVHRAVEAGVQRVVIGTMFIEQPEEAQKILARYGDSKIILGIDVREGEVLSGGTGSGLSPLSVALNAKEMGFRRIICREVPERPVRQGRALETARTIAEKTGLRVTVSGGISSLEDLFAVQELERAGIDSVLIGKAFYENRFSCQGLWRLCEAHDYPYTAKV